MYEIIRKYNFERDNMADIKDKQVYLNRSTDYSKGIYGKLAGIERKNNIE